MAMVMRGAIPGIDKWDAKILATDIDTAMVSTGAKGTYREGDVEKVPQPYRSFYQSLAGDQVQMDEKLRRLIAFKQLNLLESWPMKGPFDAIFCRNVVIYFDKPTKVKLFDRLADMLLPNGFLYIGHSENLHGVSNRFALVGRTVYQRIA